MRVAPHVTERRRVGRAADAGRAPVNLIAMGAAGYRFGDYWRPGLVTMAVFLVVAVFVVPLFWPF